MPLFVEGEDPRSPVPGYGPPPVQAPPNPLNLPPLEQTGGAAFRQSNSIVSLLSALASASPDSTPDPNWNPRTIIDGTSYKGRPLQDFLGEVNEAQTRAHMAKIDAEERDRQTLAASGWAGTVAGLAAGIVDPINYIPVIGETAKGVGVARSMLGTGARMAATGAVSTAALEAVLHATQQTRTFEESAGNVASGTLLMGILGSAMGAFSPREARTIARDFDAVRREFSPKPPPLGIAPADEVAGTFTFEKEAAPGAGATPPPPPTERISSAAIKIGDRMFAGADHSAAADNAVRAGVSEADIEKAVTDGTDGFVTSTGRFVSRQEALPLAEKAGQLNDGDGGRIAPIDQESGLAAQHFKAGELSEGPRIPGTPAETETDRLARVSRDIEDRKRSLAEWAPVPDAVFRGDADEHLATIFRSGSYDGTRVPLKNAGLSEEDITRLNRAGLADEEGKMSAGQFAQYEQARDARGLPAREAAASANGRVAEPEQALAAARAKEPEPGAVSETPTIPGAAAGSAATSSVETAARDMAANAKQALEDSGTEFDRLASQAISDHVEPLLDQAFPKVEAAPAPYKKQSEKVKAETLLAFIKRMGGIKDTGGDLKAADWVRGYPGLVNNKRGMDLDQAREAAAEAGYLGANTGQAMAGTRAADLLNALANHPTYSIHDIPEAARAATAREENARHVQIERASQSIDAHLSEVGEKPLDPEMRSTAAEILLEQDVPNVDAAIESAAIRLVEQAAEHARVHREEPQFPELDFDFTPVYEIARGETHPGPYFGDGPGAEGDAGAARREVLPAEGNRAQDQGEVASVAERAPSAAAAVRDAADAKLRAIDPEYQKALADYRARRIGDKEYLAVRARYDAAMEEWNKADIALQREPEPPPPASESGPDGTQQTLFPGVAPVTDADRLVAAAAKPMRGGDKAMPEGGLFDENIRLQRDMFDAGVPDKQHVQALMNFDREMAGAPPGGPSAAGAAPSDVRTLKLKNYGLPAIVKATPYVGAVAGKVGDALNKLSPTLRIFSSDSVQAKRMMADMAETALVFEDNARGIPTSYNGPPLDRLIRAQTHQLMIAANKHLEDEFVAYRYGDTPPRLPLERSVYEDLRGQAAGKMSFAQFKGLVSEALYSGDRSTIPQVELAAQHLRRDVVDPVARYAQSVKGPDGRPMLAEELGPPSGDKSYAPRVWNKEAIIAKRNDANRVFTDWLQNEQATKAAAKDRLIDLKFRHDDIALNASRMDRKLAVFEKRIAETDQALKERAMETNRATDRVETLEERNAQIDADAEELRQVLAESRSAVTARDADPFDMEMYDNLRRDLATLQRRRVRNEIRRDEAGIPVSASQSRFMDLADRKARYEMMRDVLTSARANEESQRLVLREKMEEEVNNWQGNTSREAKTALAARAEAERVRALKQAAQVYQGKGDRLTGADAAVDKAVDNVIKSARDLTREELSLRADEIIDRLIGSPDGRLSYDTKPIVGEPKYTGGQEVRGHLRGREFAIPSALVKDFIENDTQHLISSYLRSILPDTMLTQRFGDFEMREGFRKLNEEYAARGAGMTEAQLIALNRERQGNIRDLAATRDRLRGVYGWTDDPLQRNAARVAAVARNWNVVSDLGTVTANSFNDAGAGGVFRHGIMNVMHDSWRPMFMALTGNPTLAKAYREQAKAASIGVEGILGRSAHNLGDVIDNYRPGSKFERGLAWVTEKSMIVNLLGPWTDTMKTMASGVAAAEVLRTVERVATGAEAGRDLEKLAAASIDRAMAVKIWENFSDGGGAVIEGTPVANTADWKSMSARQAFEAAISREADIAVVTPGAEKPLWLSRPIAGLIGQFKGYIAASYERTLIAGLQQRDARTLQGLLVAVGAGMLSYRLYTWLSGREASDNPADWVKEGISRSGVLSWFFEANEDLARFTKGASDVNRLYGATRPLLRRDQSGLEALLGPTYSRLEGLSGAVGDGIRAILPGDKPKIVWTAQDTHKLRQVLLFQNLMGVRILFDKVEDGINDALGIPARRKTPTWDAAGEIAPPQGSLSAPAPPP